MCRIMQILPQKFCAALHREELGDGKYLDSLDTHRIVHLF
jgi:hypothetical protein